MGAGRPHSRPSRRPRRRPGGHPRGHGLAARDADRPVAGAIWGRHPVREALAAGYRLTRLLVARGAASSTVPLRELAGDAGVPVAFVDPGELDALAFGGNHQGVVATLASTASAGVRDLLAPHPGRAQPPLILAADQVEDVGNLGSLLRTLEACGGAGLIVPERRSAALTGGLARASAGASLRSTVVNVTNLARALTTLRSERVRIIGLDASADTPFDARAYDTPCCIVVGNEARGMRPNVRQACDAIVRVPLRSGIGSLNVAVAGAIVLHHIARQRTGNPESVADTLTDSGSPPQAPPTGKSANVPKRGNS